VTTRVFARILTSVVAFGLAAELAALAAYYVDTGALFYVHRRTFAAPLPTPDDRLVVREAVHPYFGFTHAPGTPFDVPASLRPDGAPAQRRTNKFGFVSPHAYPFHRSSENQFIVGLFGGSVGLWFCEVGAPFLADALGRHPFFRNREIVPLCFSHEGYKQPQQALVLAYFLSIGQSFDLVVNIDGFNDVALAGLNVERGLDGSMPSVQHLDPLVSLIHQSALTPDKLASLASIFRDRQQLNDLIGSMRATRLATLNFLLEQRYRRVERRYVRELGRFSTLPSAPAEHSLVQVARADVNDGDPSEEAAATWANASMAMRDMLAARGAAYFHVLQPNQYHTTRRFTAAERAVAVSDASPYKAHVERGYPKLVAAGSLLRGRNVAFLDATHAFDAEPAPVYMDNCCHYTLTGNRRLAEFIASSILDSAGPWQ
jgi:hypothetical protein